ncbi:MAG TPA: hypothetical protein VNW73_11615 [Ktedonobacteraceae bacterium]|jgi:hypothetical protein|nr:hypothetical protein [Ktedonobacteraceae bacterium]
MFEERLALLSYYQDALVRVHNYQHADPDVLFEQLMQACERFATLVESIPISAQQGEGMHEEVGPLTLPNPIALQRTERIVFLVAHPLTLFVRLFHPFIALINGLERALAHIGFATWRALPIRKSISVLSPFVISKPFPQSVDAGRCLLSLHQVCPF